VGAIIFFLVGMRAPKKGKNQVLGKRTRKRREKNRFGQDTRSGGERKRGLFPETSLLRKQNFSRMLKGTTESEKGHLGTKKKRSRAELGEKRNSS